MWRNILEWETKSEQQFTPGVYQHFKGGFYLCSELVVDAETEETKVVYSSLFNPKKKFTRNLSSFFDDVSNRKDNTTGQKYRFEKVDKNYGFVIMKDVQPGGHTIRRC